MSKDDTIAPTLSKVESNAAKASVSIKADDKILAKDENNALYAITISAVTPLDTTGKNILLLDQRWR